MPIFWNYIIKNFCKVFCLSTFSFSFLLLLTRATTIARYASLAASPIDVIYFIAIQIPHILPVAIPLSCFIASFLVIRSLSLTSEITALRSAGLSFFQIILPIVIVSFFLTLLNFYISAELTPKLRYKSQDFLINKTSSNPVNLLKKQKLLKIKDSYISFKKGENNEIEDIVFVTFHPSFKKLLLLTAKELIITKDQLKGVSASLISSIKTAENNFDHLIIENQLLFSSPSFEIASVMKKNKKKLLRTYSSLKHLKIKASDQDNLKIYYSELFRRLILSFYVFTFSFIGIAFGFSNQRNITKKSFFLAIVCIITILTSYLSIKSLKVIPSYIFLAYITPIIGILTYSMNYLKKALKGVN